MKLRKPCEHGRYEPHFSGTESKIAPNCPGGVFLPDDTLIIETVDALWPESAIDALWDLLGSSFNRSQINTLLDALTREAK